MIKLLNGDCHKLLKDIPDNSIDLILTDPPYNTTRNKYDQSILDWSIIWPELKRIGKQGTPCLLFAQHPFTEVLLKTSTEFIGKKSYKHYWIWRKNLAGNFATAKYMPLSVTEEVLVFSLDQRKVNYYPIMVPYDKPRMVGSKNSTKNGRGFGSVKNVYRKKTHRYPTNDLPFNTVVRSKSLHPSQKPVQLLEYLITTYSKENNTVLDFCMGVGSTGIAAHHLNRNFIGFELDKKYFSLAENRINTE